MSTRTPAPALVRQARMECNAVAVGPFTPIVLQPYELFGGEHGYALGYPSETVSGHGCIVWTHRATTKEAA